MREPMLIPGRAVGWIWPDGPFAGRHVGRFLGFVPGPDGLSWCQIAEGPYLFLVSPRSIAAVSP